MNSASTPAATVNTSLRVSHAERDACVDALQHGFEIGQLDQIELEDRVEAALSAKTTPDLQILLADLNTMKLTGSRSAMPIGRRQVAMGLAAVVCLVAGLAGVAAGSYDSNPPSSGACITTGLISDADCPAPSAEQEQLMDDVQAAADAAAQAQTAADEAAKGSPARDWANKAEDAATRAADAEREAQAIVATAPEGRPKTGALKGPAKTARAASRDAIQAALQAEAATAGS